VVTGPEGLFLGHRIALLLLLEAPGATEKKDERDQMRGVRKKSWGVGEGIEVARSAGEVDDKGVAG